MEITEVKDFKDIVEGKTYKCNECGKVDICKKTCYGLSFTYKHGTSWCRDCDMESFFNKYGSGRD